MPQTKTIPIILTSTLIGLMVYRYYSFSLLYLEQEKLQQEAKKISLEYREISLWYQKRKKTATETSVVDHPKILIEIETD